METTHEAAALSPERQRPSATWPIIAVLLLALVVLFSGMSVLRKAPAQHWEYMVTAPHDSTLITSLNSLGAEGWEVVSARRASDGSSYSPTFAYEVILKRPVSR